MVHVPYQLSNLQINPLAQDLNRSSLDKKDEIFQLPTQQRMLMQVKQSAVSGSSEQGTARSAKPESTPAKSAAPTLSTEKPAALNAAQLQDMSTYLKVVSRLENLQARENELPEAAVEGFVRGLEKQINQMNEHEKALLLRIPEIRGLQVSNAQELLKKLGEDLASSTTAPAAFKVLRQPQFVELVDPSHHKMTYSAKPVASNEPAPAVAAVSAPVQQPNPEATVLPTTTPVAANSEATEPASSPTV